MNKELTNHVTESQDAFTVELGQAVHDILNRLSDAELDRLLAGEDHTFLNQMTPEGALLLGEFVAEAPSTCAYAWCNFSLAVSAWMATSIVAVPHHGTGSSEWAANRRDLALAA